MAAFDRNDLQRRGFVGYAPISTLDPEPPEVPRQSGVYAVVRTEEDVPRFLDRGGGGWFKGKDPTVPPEQLAREWVDGAQTLYLGKADSLRSRVGLLARFARGEPVFHWGGRLLWQVERCETLLVAWKVEEYFGALESDLIDEFIEAFGRLPFANLKRGDRNVLRPTPPAVT
jgi:hypothetical protein